MSFRKRNQLSNKRKKSSTIYTMAKSSDVTNAQKIYKTLTKVYTVTGCLKLRERICRKSSRPCHQTPQSVISKF